MLVPQAVHEAVVFEISVRHRFLSNVHAICSVWLHDVTDHPLAIADSSQRLNHKVLPVETD